jgi:hypothetical protein
VNWRFEHTPELVPRHRQQLVWAMQRQDERMQARFRSGQKWLPPWVLIILGVFGAVALALVVASGPTHTSDWVFIALSALLFAVAIVRGVQLTVRGPEPRPRIWQMTNRTIARVADRTFRKVHATYIVEYELTGTELRSRVASAGIDHTVDLATIKVAIVTPNSIVLFRRRLSQVPKRIVYVDGAERDAVLAVVSRAIIERVDGPVEGYAADSEIPRAIVR